MSQTDSSASQAPLVIVGSGLAGYHVAREVRQRDAERPIMLVTQDSGDFYSKPLLSTAVAKQQTPEALVQKTAGEMAAELNLIVRTSTRVESIDRVQRTLVIGHERQPWSQLVLATGAEPIRLPLAGSESVLLHSVNDLDDYRYFRKKLKPGDRVAVLGAGLVGVEFAHDLSQGGYPVDLVAPESHLLPRLIPAPVAAPLEQALAAQGVRFHLGYSAEDAQATANGVTLGLCRGGGELNVQHLLGATGLKPRTRLAQAAGLHCERGICVDRQLRTSDPDIFALGDCAEIDGLSLMYVQPLMASARILAQVLTAATSDADESPSLHLQALPILVKTAICPIVAALPPVGVDGRWHFETLEQGVVGCYTDAHDTLQGFALSGQAVRKKAQLTRQLPPLLA